MLRRLIVAGLAAALAAPLLIATTPASAVVLFTCGNGSGSAYLTPGLGETPTAQTDVDADAFFSSCSNGATATVGLGNAWTTNNVASVANDNGKLTCASNPPSNTPMIVGFTDPSMQILWDFGAVEQTSTGITKIKASGNPLFWKLVLVITGGPYAPPSGQKTKVKGGFQRVFASGFGSCTDADPITKLDLIFGSGLIVQQV